MRYLGNKTSIVEYIVSKLKDKKLLDKGLTFFDACCGTGAVSYAVKDYFKIILNDNLLLATTFAKGHIVKDNCTFSKLGFNPFDFFNQNQKVIKGFFYSNYAPTISGRMYFSDFNAGRIDYFRNTIEDWFVKQQITENEYCYLLSSLQESASKVANIAGVYGAFLKTWDSRAVKPIVFLDADGESTFTNKNKNLFPIQTFNLNIEDSIENISCDVLYLDPPYTKNSYSVQYHILETLIRNDNPALKGKTGARPYHGISNVWSKQYEAEIAFDKIVAKTKAKHILFSYSTDGLMSKDFIINVLKRYCKEESVELQEIPYKKYLNSKSGKGISHYEYLFYGEKKDEKDIEYYCPLNYMGGKSNIIKYIKPHLGGKTKFLDLMGGGFNVGINANLCNKIIYNDINFKVAGLIEMFQKSKTTELLKFIDTTIAKYELTKNGAENYCKLRMDYNQKYRNTEKEFWYLYVLILYGFQQQIRFNSKYEFNNPIGESGYSDSIKEKIVSFSRRIKEMDLKILVGDFEKTFEYIDKNTLVYADPPYLITLGSYNDGKRGFNGWNENEELRLLDFFDKILSLGCKLVLSNIIEYKELKNNLLQNWINKHTVIIENICVRKRNEVLVICE